MEKPSVVDSAEQPAADNQLPTTGSTLFEYFFDLKRMVWIAYEWIVPAYLHDIQLKFDEIFVPTIESVRMNQILNLLGKVSAGDYIKAQYSILVVI